MDNLKRLRELTEHFTPQAGDIAHIVAELLSDGLVVTGVDGHILYINHLGLVLFGYTAEEILGEKVETLVPESRREGHVEKRELFVKERGTRRLDDTLQVQGRKKDGTVFPIRLGLAPISWGNDYIGTIAVIQVVRG